MVDGRVLPKPEAAALRASILDLVRQEALPKLGSRNPSDALQVLDKLRAYGFAQLEGERAPLERARASKFPPPPPATWPELVELREAAARRPDVCRLGAPAGNVYFAKALEEDGLPLPEDLLALYAACNGFDLSCASAPHIPVFSMLAGESIDVCEQADGTPPRAAVFQGGDEVQLCAYRDRKKAWWLVYEFEFEPVGKKLLDLRDLVRFGLKRMGAPAVEALDGELSWERFFEVS